MKKLLLFLFVALLGSHIGRAQVVNTEGFESGTMPPADGWTDLTSSAPTWYWSTVTSGNTGYPSVTVSPHSGSYEGYFDSYDDDYTGSSYAQTICSPSFSRSAIGSATDSVSFWMYRDNGYSTDNDEIKIYINTSASTSGATLLGTVVRYTGSSTPSSVSSDGWYRYSFVVPSGFSGSTNYILVSAISQFGNSMFVDDISYTSYPPACSGAPTAGTISGPSSVCPSTGFGLTLTGDSVASGLTYQWYSSPSGAGTFTAISGATNNYWSVSSLTSATDYEFVVTCTASGLSDTTSIFTVNATPFYTCYCSPSTGTTLDYSSYYSPIDYFSISGTTLSNTTAGSSAYYTDYVPTTDSTTGTMDQGSAYVANILSDGSSSSYTYNAGFWIDYDHSGTFDASEFTNITSSGPWDAESSATFIIPTTADTGVTGMRVRCTWEYYGFGSGDACTEEYYGATQDYLVTIGLGVPCTGTPAASTAYASQSVVCATGSFNLYDTGYSNSLGISYQWYSSPSGAASWSAMYGGSSIEVSGVTQSFNTDYILVTSCSYSGLSDTSNIVTVNMSPFYLCYCSPLTGTTLDEYTDYTNITDFYITGTSLNNPSSGTAVYTQYWPVTSTTTGTLDEGSSYTAFVTSNPTYTYDNYDAGIWIDYDHSGTFDGSEYYALGSGVSEGSSTSATFMVPSTGVDTGLTGLRVETAEYFESLNSGSACSNLYDGAVQDYVVNIQPGVPCSGTPSSGTAYASQSTVCDGSVTAATFNLADTGFTEALGISYQWYYSPTGAATWSAIYGGSSSTVSGVSQSVATDYILVTSCSYSGLTDTSNIVTVGMSPFYLCYCSPLTGTTLDEYGVDYANITDFSITGTTLNNPSSGTSVYTQYWPVTSTTTGTVDQGSSYTASVTSNSMYTYYGYNSGMWIDYDHSGTFDASEYYTMGSDVSQGTASTATFIVPSTSDTGATGLRVSTSYQYETLSGGGACYDYYYGATQDYVINIQPGAPCSGTPVSGTAYASVSTICNGSTTSATFSLTDTAFTEALGISYQWYSSPTGAGSWSAIYGGSSTAISGVSQSVASDYILVTSCSYSGLTDTSNIVTVGMSPFYLCYCSPLTGTTLDYYTFYSNITDFSISGTSLSNSTSGTALYTQYWPTTSSTTATLDEGSSYTATVLSNATYTFENYNAGIWIDYDHSGTFDASEFYSLGSDVAQGTSTSASFIVPSPSSSVTIDTGLTGLRVETAAYFESLSSSSACSDLYYGEVQDYVINVQPGIPCSGTPASGTAYSSQSTVCASVSGATFSLTDTAFTEGYGITYQWYSSPSGAGSWTALYTGSTPSVTNVSQDTATDYIFVTTCSVSGFTDTSNIVTVGMSPFYLCYCSPLTSTTLDEYIYYANITDFSISGTTLSNSSAGTALYTQYWPTTSTTTGTIDQGSVYTATVLSNAEYTFENYDAGMWIDYDHSGTFNASEFYSLGSNISQGTSTSTSFLVPPSADTGATGLRVETAAYFESLSSTSACSDLYYGAVQDYVINIQPGVPCAGTPDTSTAFGPYTTCGDVPVTLTDTGFTATTGITYQWYSSPSGAGTFTPIAGATTYTYTYTQTVATDYYFVTKCTVSGDSAMSNTFTVLETPFYACYCTSSFASDDSYYGWIDSVSIFGTTLNVYNSSTNGYVQEYPVTLNPGGDSTATLQAASTYTVDINTDAYYTYFDPYIAMWIDYNHSGTFDATEFTYISSGSSAIGTSALATFTVPPTSDTGLTGLRVRTNPFDAFSGTDACTDDYEGQTIDFIISITPPPACAGVPSAGVVTASPGTACDSAHVVLTDLTAASVSGVTFQWQSSADGSTWSSISGATTDPYNAGTITANTYYRLIVGCTASGFYDTSASFEEIFSPVCYCTNPSWSFSEPPLDYAMSEFQVAGGYAGTSLTDASVAADANPVNGYCDHTGLTPVLEMQQGGSYPITVTYQYADFYESYGWESQVWIDFNSVGFNDSDTVTEAFGQAPYTSDVYSNSDTIRIPAGATPGYHRMRVRTTWMDWGSYSSSFSDPMDPCASSDAIITYGTGDVVDYTVYIVPNHCDSVYGIYANSITGTTATIGWDSIPSSNTYVYVVDTSATAPTAGGTPTIDTAVNLTSLVPGTTYYVWVLNSCAPGDSSVWEYTTFSTPCDTVSGLTVGTVTGTSATVSWTAVAGATTYDYVIDGTPGSPTGAGTATTATSETFTGLTPGTIYYAHVRNACPGGGFSAWETVLVEIPCDTISGLAVSAITDVSAIGSWDTAAGSLGYQYVLSTTPGTPTGAGTSLTTNSVSLTSLTPATTYYLYVRNSCVSGATSPWAVDTFTTGFCDSVAASSISIAPDDTGLVFAFTGVAGSTGYYYAITTSPVAPTTGYTFTTATTDTVSSLTPGSSYYLYIYTGCGTGSSSTTSVPFTTTICDSVTGLSVVSSDTGLVITFNSSSTSIGYQYAVTTTPGAPTSGYTATTDTTVDVTGLTSGTVYFVYVRSSCGGGYSTWTSVAAATYPCDTTSVSVYANDTFAYVSWAAAPGAGGYQYIVNTDPSTPSGSGTFTTATADTELTLTAGTTYYAHVRVYCGAGNYSAWTTVPFTLAPCDTTAAAVIIDSPTYVKIDWVYEAGAAGYNYVLNTTAAAPTSGGTFTTDTTMTQTGLIPGTTYYFHIQVICGVGSGSSSSWITISFSTPSEAVQTVNNVDFDVKAFPNPAINTVTVKATGNMGNNRTVELTDVTGKIISRVDMVTNQVDIDMSYLASGIYMIRYTDDTHSQVIKVNKQ